MQIQRKVSRELYDQRDEEMFWSPQVKGDFDISNISQLGKNLWYVVVDDIQEDTVILQIAKWPKLDKGNHLCFNEIYERSYPLTEFQNVINEGRKKQGQPAADRPLRTGDVFMIYAEELPDDVFNPESKDNVLDITAAAREQAKIAMYGAVARRLSPMEADSRLEPTLDTDRFKRFSGIRDQFRPSSPEAIAKPEV